VIERRLEERNSVGEITYSFEHARTIWAELHGDYATCRYFGECFPGWRLKIEPTQFFEITGVIDLPQKVRLVKLLLKEIRAGLDMHPAPRRWIAKPGFRHGESQRGIEDGDSP